MKKNSALCIDNPLGDKEMTTYHMRDPQGNSEMENWILPAFFHSILTYFMYSS